MPIAIFKTIGGANEESIELVYDATAGRYQLKTVQTGSGTHYAIGFKIGANEFFQLTTDRKMLPITDAVGDIGSGTFRFNLVRAVTITPGDLNLSDKKTGKELWTINEDEEFIYFRHFKTQKIIMKLDGDGNIYIGGEVRKL